MQLPLREVPFIGSMINIALKIYKDVFKNVVFVIFVLFINLKAFFKQLF